MLLGSSALAGEAENKAAVSLVKLLITPTSYDAMIDQISTQMSASISQSGGQLPPDFVKKMKPVVLEALSYDDMVKWTAEIYADRFSVAELNDLSKFYHTSTGAKIARLLPEITGETGKKLGTLLPQRLPALLKKHGLIPGDSPKSN
jgi:hypothetical protein